MNSENTSPVKVSIVCTAYNHERYIRQTLDGFLMQKTDFPIEVLINDDASTDATARIIREYEQKYPDIIKPTYQTQNQYSQGKSVSLPLFLKARGEYVAWCEGDDFWVDEKKLQLQVDFMDSHPSYSLCAHSGYRAYEDGVFMNGLFRPFDRDTKVETAEVISRWLFPTASILYRRSMRKVIPEPFKQNSPVGDYPLAVYLATEGDVYYIDRPMCAYRVNSVSSLSRQHAKQLQKAAAAHVAIMALADRIDDYTGGAYRKEIYAFKVNSEYNRLITLNRVGDLIRSPYYRDIPTELKLRLWRKALLFWLAPVVEPIRNYRARQEYARCRQAMDAVQCDNIVILESVR